MINKKTVLILGAGASIPYGFPSGEELYDQVCDMLMKRSREFQLIEDCGFCSETITDFAKNLSDSDLRSVDIFLEKRFDNKEFVKIGKAAIATALLPRENPEFFSKVMRVKRKRWRMKTTGSEKRPDSWYQLLFKTLIEDATFDTFKDNKLAIITFNYDRSLEHYLFTTLQSTYGKPPKECEKQLREIPIIHVHGSLGRLEWQPEENHPFPQVRYGSTLDKDFIISASSSIKIIPETLPESEEFKRAHELCERASRIYFLGFGYHRDNINKLKMTSLPKGISRDIRGTAVDLPISTEGWLTRLKFCNSCDSITLEKQCKIYEFLNKMVDLTL